MAFVKQRADDGDHGVDAPRHRIASFGRADASRRSDALLRSDAGSAGPEPPGGTPGTIDHRRSRRLGHPELWIWYLLAAVTYIGLGVFHKFLFNWFIGPIWLIAVVVIGPALWDWRRRSTRAGK